MKQSRPNDILVGTQRFPDTPEGRARANAYRIKTGQKATPIRKPLPGETPAMRRIEEEKKRRAQQQPPPKRW